MGEALGVYQGLFSLRPSTTTEATISELFMQSALPVALTLYVVTYNAIRFCKLRPEILPPALRMFRAPAYAQVIAVASFALLVVGLAPQKSIPFIYFRF
jgi:hypothetical protein